MNEIDKILKRNKLIKNFGKEYKKGCIDITTAISEQLRKLGIHTSFFVDYIILKDSDMNILRKIKRFK